MLCSATPESQPRPAWNDAWKHVAGALLSPPLRASDDGPGGPSRPPVTHPLPTVLPHRRGQ